VTEHESAKTPDATPEAKCSRDVDKIECLLQAREYQREGYTQLDRWVTTMAEAVTTPTGKRLATAALGVSPAAWWTTSPERSARRGPNDNTTKLGGWSELDRWWSGVLDVAVCRFLDWVVVVRESSFSSAASAVSSCFVGAFEDFGVGRGERFSEVVRGKNPPGQ
jgi:hypothetical protein